MGHTCGGVPRYGRNHRPRWSTEKTGRHVCQTSLVHKYAPCNRNKYSRYTLKKEVTGRVGIAARRDGGKWDCQVQGSGKFFLLKNLNPLKPSNPPNINTNLLQFSYLGCIPPLIGLPLLRSLLRRGVLCDRLLFVSYVCALFVFSVSC